MFHYHLVLAVSLTFGSVLAFAQETAIRGVLRAQDSREPVVGAMLMHRDSDAFTVSDANGLFSLSVPDDTVWVHIRSLGFRDTTFRMHRGQSAGRVFFLSPSNVQLGTVVVSASRYAERRATLNVSAEVVSPQLINDRNTVDADEVLQQVPGVVVINEEVQIRSGSGFSFGAGSRAMVLLDGMPLLSGDIGKATWSYLPIENVEQIEVLKGASSVLYGSAALSGVIDLRTRMPSDSIPHTRIAAFTGAYSQPRTNEGLYWRQPGYGHRLPLYETLSELTPRPLLSGFAVSHLRRINRLDISASLNVAGDMGYTGPYYRTNAEGEPINYSVQNGDTLYDNAQAFSDRARANVRLRYRIGKGRYAGLAGGFMASHSAAPFLWYNLDSSLYRPFNQAITTTQQRVFHIDPFYEHASSDGLTHLVRARVLRVENTNTNAQNNRSTWAMGEYMVQQEFVRGPLQRVRITAGLTGSLTRGVAELYSGNENNDPTNNASNVAFYADVLVPIGERLRVNGGARYERNTVNTDLQAASIFRSGINYQLARATWLRASFGQGYRFPTIGERYIRTTVGTYNIFPNTNLQPERSYSAEIGARQGFKIGNLQGFADVSAFLQHYTDFIEFTFGLWGTEADTVGPGIVVYDPLEVFGFRSVNTGEARITGLDAVVGFSYEIGRGSLMGQLGYTYTLPRTQSPDKVYAEQSSLATNRDVTYRSTSSNPDNNILKYRFQHLLKGDADFRLGRAQIGASARFFSAAENIDRAFTDLDELGLVPTGIAQWRKERNDPVWVVDTRAYIRLTDTGKIGLVVNNLLNNEYSLRPLVIEAPRTVIVRYEIVF